MRDFGIYRLSRVHKFTVFSFFSDFPHTATCLIIQEYSKYVKSKRIQKNKKLWAQISETLEKKLGLNKSGDDCYAHYTYILNKHKDAITHNATSGSNLISVPYEKEFEELRLLDDSLMPEFVMSSKICKYFKDTK